MRLLLAAMMAVTLAVGGTTFAPEVSAKNIKIGGEIKGNPPGTGPSRTSAAPRSILTKRTNPNQRTETRRLERQDAAARAAEQAQRRAERAARQAARRASGNFISIHVSNVKKRATKSPKASTSKQGNRSKVKASSGRTTPARSRSRTRSPERTRAVASTSRQRSPTRQRPAQNSNRWSMETLVNGVPRRQNPAPRTQRSQKGERYSVQAVNHARRPPNT
ncbi:MAG: hypothetical protein AAF580_17805 [Pseudomonadota bacterium]